MNRRSFFASLVNPPAPAASDAPPKASITTRTGSHGERVSLLGYGALSHG